MSTQASSYRYDALEADYPAAVECIRQARVRLEQENEQHLQEQARLRAEAQVRAVPPSGLLLSRTQDLQRLERERQRAEYQVIEAVETRMELELRAIEADNERLKEEVRAEELARQRLQQARQEIELIQQNAAEEAHLSVLLRQKTEQAQQALEATEARKAVQNQLIVQIRIREQLEVQLQRSQQQTLQHVQQEVLLHSLLHDVQRRERHLHWALGLNGLTAGLLAGLAYWSQAQWWPWLERLIR